MRKGKNFKFKDEKHKKQILGIVRELYLQGYKRKNIYAGVTTLFDINPHYRTVEGWIINIEKELIHNKDAQLMIKWRKEYYSEVKINKSELMLNELYETAKVKGYLKNE